MSTRATYQIKTPLNTSTVYIHYDGYLSGAAEYFRDAIDLMRISGRQFLPCFLWANENAEMTKSHDWHGDTEYRYDLEKKAGIWSVVAYKRQSYDSDVFNVVYDGNLSNFVNEYATQKAA